MSIPETLKNTIPGGQRPQRVGIFAAAGNATRLKQGQTHITASKEILRVRNIRQQWHPCMQRSHPLDTAGTDTPVGNYLIDSFLHADVDQCIIVTRAEKVDLLNYYSAKSIGDMRIQRITVSPTPGTPWTIAHGLQSLLHSEPYCSSDSDPGVTFALGFPDIITTPEDVFQRLFMQLGSSRCDVVLGLFRVDNPQKYDMVQFESSPNGRQHVTGIDIKPEVCDGEWTWVCAVWNITFSQYLIEFTNSQAKLSSDQDNSGEHRSGEHVSGEVYVGNILTAALSDGLNIECLRFEQGGVLDIGTPADLELAQSAAAEKLF